MQAAMLRVKLPHLDADNARRRAVADAYRARIRHPHIRLPAAGASGAHVWHLFVVRSARRQALREHLAAHGVQAQVHYPVPPHRQAAYASLRELSMPLTERLHAEVLSLPMAATLRNDQVERVVEACMSFAGGP
jgi:dTDP-4-amino-4,6-dideoxygalactose transaminase